MNWRGKPLVSHQVIVQLIGSTSTETGLKVCCEIDRNLYPKGLKVTEREMQAVNIARHNFHGEWNYTISPNQQPPWCSNFSASPNNIDLLQGGHPYSFEEQSRALGGINIGSDWGGHAALAPKHS